MPRVCIIPDGRIVHIPADGKPLRNYALALADVERDYMRQALERMNHTRTLIAAGIPGGIPGAVTSDVVAAVVARVIGGSWRTGAAEPHAGRGVPLSDQLRGRGRRFCVDR